MSSEAKKILITEDLGPQADQLFLENALLVEITRTGDFERDYQKLLPQTEILLVRTATQIGETQLSVAKNLKLIGRAGTGFDNIDIEACRRHGILVMNTPEESAVSTAEHTIGLLLSA